MNVNEWSIKKQVTTLLLITLGSSLLLCAFFANHFEYLYRYWDGPNYVWVAKSLYSTDVHHPLTPYGTTPAYFACHLPMYPLLIRLFSFIGYFPAMLLVTLMSTCAAVVAYFLLLRELKIVQSPFWTSVYFLFIPARFLIYHTVGATEPLFIFFMLLSIYYFFKQNNFSASLFAGLASITRITGVLLPVAYFIILVANRKWREIPKLIISALPILFTFSFYHFQFGDFWAYFSWNHKLIHGVPFDILSTYAGSADGRTAEFYILLYSLFGYAVIRLWEKNKNLCIISGVLYIFNLFIYHEDLSRYFIPLASISFLISMDDLLNKKQFRWFFGGIVVPLTYVYCIFQLPMNMIADWVFKNLQGVL